MPCCFLCGEAVEDEILRLQLGLVQYKKRGPIFLADTFEDGSAVKWIHPKCAPGCYPHLMRYDYCAICGHQFYEEESALFIEAGEFQGWRRRSKFDGESGGVLHYICAEEELGFDLWRE